MPSIVHQWLITWIARKMTVDGYRVEEFEGPAPQAGHWNLLRTPSVITAVKPDLWAVRVNCANESIAIGEAKSLGDIDNSHTREQLRVFSNLFVRRTHARCVLYIGIPRSGSMVLDRVLTDCGLFEHCAIRRIHVPDRLLAEVPNG